ncbi:MAG: pilus assembly protein [Alphaproteobacteria bacterium]|nr:pilus assembly protein [Alphaproteobacteria bacterium]
MPKKRPFLTALRSRRGTIAMTAGLLAIPVMITVGMGVDLARVFYVRSRLINAVDAGALAGAREITSPTRDNQVRSFFWANFDMTAPNSTIGVLNSSVISLTVTPNADNSNLRVRGEARVPLVFMPIVGIGTWDVAAEAVARRAERQMELALVLDITGSMATGNRIGALRDAATDLVDIVFGPEAVSTNLRVSVVPYTATVNLGPTRSAWLGGGVDYTQYQNSPFGWKGCVEARHTGGNDMNDAPPAVAPFTPFLWRSTSTTNYMTPAPARRITGDNEWQPNTITEQNQHTLGNRARGPNLGCGLPVLPLTDTKANAQNLIAQFVPTYRGGTMANLGLQAGWFTISPNWRGLWGDPARPFDYNANFTDKVVVLMTDGNNEWYDWPGESATGLSGAPGQYWDPQANNGNGATRTFNGDADYTAYGRLLENRLGLAANTRANATTEINRRMGLLCDAMKRQGIIMYTITFANNNAATQNLYRACASQASFYFNSPSDSDLRNAFREIGRQLANLRLSR